MPWTMTLPFSMKFFFTEGIVTMKTLDSPVCGSCSDIAEKTRCCSDLLLYFFQCFEGLKLKFPVSLLYR